MSNTRRWITVLVLACLMSVGVAPAQEKAVFPITEQSVLDDEGQIPVSLLTNGLTQVFGGPCSKTPLRDVKYPESMSPEALYGQVMLRASGGYPGMIVASEPAAGSICFAVDKSKADAAKYDVLFFDSNGDRVLTNEEKIVAVDKSPFGAVMIGGSGSGTTYFNAVVVKLGDQEAKTEQFLPWLTLQTAIQSPLPSQAQVQPLGYLMFVSTMQRKAKIEIGQKSYEVVMGGPAQGPNARAWLRSATGEAPAQGLALMLGRMQVIDDQFLTLSVDAKGEQLTITPYEGEYGEIAIRRDENSPERLGLAAQLMGQDQSSFTLGDYYAAELAPKLRLPVGDYRASYLIVDCGTVRASLSSQGFGLKVRAGESFLLEFGERPVVTFSDPMPSQAFRPGATVGFRAMLADRDSGLMIRGLMDTSNTIQQRTIRDPDGTQRSVPVYAPLVPTVTITDATGKEVARGDMPFG